MITIKNKQLVNYLCFKLNKIEEEFTSEELCQIDELNLNPIDISGDVEDIDISVLKHFKNLQTITFSNMCIYMDIFEYLEKMENLKEITFDRCEFEDVDNIPMLKVKAISFINCENVNHDIVFSISNIESLSLVNENNVDVDKVNELKSLKHLQLSYSRMNDNSKKFTLPDLEEIYIDNTNIENLNVLENTEKIKILGISESQLISNLEYINCLKEKGVAVYEEGMIRL